MADFEHLPLPKTKRKFERRKLPAPIPRPPRDYPTHRNKLKEEANKVIASSLQHKAIEGIDPSLILSAKMGTMLAEEEWRKAGFTILASDIDKTLILFSSDVEMADFKKRLEKYGQGIPENQKDASYAGLFSFIEEIKPIFAVDRIGPRFKNDGITSPELFEDDKIYIVDISLWDAPPPKDRQFYVDCLRNKIEKIGGTISSQYIGDTGWMLVRAAINGKILKTILELAQIQSIDLPPKIDIESGDEKTESIIKDFKQVLAPPENAPKIGLIDSGISANPLLEPAIFERFGIPERLGDADEKGHGTPVGAICVYGDIAANAEQESFEPAFWLCSAKVVDETGNFPPEMLVETQMKEAITKLVELGCRIINISLGDRTAIYADGKVSHWAATLDELSRHFNVLIIVSAGNANPANGKNIDYSVTEYPSYLTDSRFRIYEPATACNVLTVGAISHTNGLSGKTIEEVTYQAICDFNEPSPLTRTGPGINNTIKPDLVDYGGTLVFDGGTQRLLSGQQYSSAGIKSLNSDYLSGLFINRSGTSYAAPFVTYKASLLLRRFPNASANLLRALLVVAADIPQEALKRLENIEDNSKRFICGHGLSDVERALASEEKRTILYAEDELTIDEFAVFEIPIINEFREIKGNRHIRVTLAFDPPTRHTRNDYLGIRMNFRVMRDMTLHEVTDFFRSRTPDEEKFKKLKDIQKLGLKPGPNTRDKGTLQTATLVAKRKMKDYGDPYYLVVRCEGKWASSLVEKQRYAIVVEIRHEGEIELHQRLRPRVKA